MADQNFNWKKQQDDQGLARDEMLAYDADLDAEYEDPDFEERDYRPIRFRRDGRRGCLGGLMYGIFVISLSIVLACVGWMFASDVLALNKAELSATVTLPKDIFEYKEEPVLDDDGNPKYAEDGTALMETVTYADIDYVATELKNAGLIEYTFLFELFAKFANADTKIDPGTYALTTELDYRALVSNMQVGSENQVETKVTFPEGFTMHQIFQRLDEYNICSYVDLINAAANYDFTYPFLEDIPLGDASRLEGFLFPDTYYFYEGMSATGAIDKLLGTFHLKRTQEMIDLAAQMGYSFRDVITIASMIEKEAANDEERATIASVIYNRLASGMALGVDATSLYTHPDHEGAPTDEMLNDASDPYNTRINTGLPPSPICSPGINSINAAFKPASTNYYYYALDTATGVHRFFTNQTDFNNFVATQNYE